MRVLATVLCLVLAACGRAQPAYPPAYELNFMRACEAQGARAEFCACTWEQVEGNVAAADFAALERLPAAERQSHPLQAQIAGYAQACRAEAP